MSEQPIRQAAPENPGQAAEDPRVTQALEEYLAALEAGHAPDPAKLRARYPDIADELCGLLSGLEFMHRASADIQASSCSPLITFGVEPPGGAAPPLEDYEVVREVGRGGMGIVYEAVQRSLHRRVALKVLSLAATLDPRHLQRFKNEAQAAAQLQHPNIVPVFAVGCEQGVHYYAMRFIEGRSLGMFIRELRGERDGIAAPAASTDAIRAAATAERSAPNDTRITDSLPAAAHLSGDPVSRPLTRDAGFFRQAAWFGAQAAEALEHAHQVGVIHRDVKPANLLLDREGRLWVTDFGLARWAADDALTMTGDVLGTLRYMSPEQASARRGLVDHRTDVYSLGATLYELLTLEPVFRGEDRQELLHHILEDDPVPPRRLCPDIPHDLETILLRAMGKRPEERYATAQELADDLRRFLDGRPVLARRPSVWERAGRWARRHVPVVVTAAALLLVVGLGVAAGAVIIGQERQAAYEKEVAAREKVEEAAQRESDARARAERDFLQAQQLLDYVSDIAANDMTADSDLASARRKLLKAALAYYESILKQEDGNKLTNEDLLRGRVRVAALLEAIGRREEAQAARDQAGQLALVIGEGQASYHFPPAQNRLRLLRRAAVQRDLKLSPDQVEALTALEAKGQAPPRGKPRPDGEGEAGQDDSAEPLARKAVALLNPDQNRRLEQLRLQQLGTWAFKDDAVRPVIQLSDAQRQAIADIRNGPKASERAEKPLDRALGQLTEEQRARWQELVGERFAGQLPPPDCHITLDSIVIRFERTDKPKEPRKPDPGVKPEASAP
jgi:serine/threonine protein kinase